MEARDDGSHLFSPTDLVNFLGCFHSTVLDVRALAEPVKHDDASESEALLRRKGEEHEAAYLQTLKDQGRSVAEIPKEHVSIAERSRLTREAMRKGADVIYQAALLFENWGGYADFLVKTDRPSALGSYSYEATDTKLARHPHVKHLIQLGVYSNLLASRQGVQPKKAHVVLGDQKVATFSVSDFDSYVRNSMQRLEDFAAAPPFDSYPAPCSHCSTCHWNETCTAQWQADDHVYLVAGIQRSQAAKLERAGASTVAKLASWPLRTRIPDLNPQVLDRLRTQAALQEHKRCTGENKMELIESDPGRGFARLPKPDPGDLFFDMEGDPLHPQGLEYLFGVCLLRNGHLDFKPFWAHNHDDERITFGQFMEFLRAHLTTYSGAYIYHYNHYETTALKRLACRYAIAEHQLDDLLRRRRFVDLFTVVREGIRVSEPAYSIKNLETFYMEKRDGDVATAGESIVVYNRWCETRDPQLLQQIEDYNRLDCVSTSKLRDWLLIHRPHAIAWFDGPPPPSDADAAADKSAARLEREARYVDFQARLLNAATDGQDDYRRHLADLLEFHAREGRPQWWEFFDRQSRFEDELLDDTECVAGLTMVGPPVQVKRSFVYSFEFPPQETKRRAGDQVFDVATLSPAGTIENLDEENLIVGIKRGAKNDTLPENLTIGPGGPINTDALREAIYRFATDVLAGGNRYPAIRDILSKAFPRIHGRRQGQAIADADDLLAAITAVAAGLADSYLFIQGPPGAGKTHTSAHVVVELMRRGKTIGVAANSHKAIHNLLDMIERTAQQSGVSFQGIKKSSAGNPESVYTGRFIHSEDKIENISLSASLLAGSAWLFAHERFDRHLDYLVIDEAGQVCVANVVAMGTAARNILLVGDQMQLGQPIQGVHPGEAGASILDFLLADRPTVTPDRGIFLSQTRRLHPSICTFVSDAFYEGRLHPHPGNAVRRLIFQSPVDGLTSQGIHFLPVAHAGCSQKSEEEARIVKDYYHRLIGQQFVDKDRSTRRLTANDILVVSPYNVQVNHLKSVLPTGARVGTVDKFQGQEAPAVMLSMATSDAECLPREIDFLFSANRLNVALSRAQCLAVVIANPRLLETPCRTISQLRLINKFCQLVEYAAACAQTSCPEDSHASVVPSDHSANTIDKGAVLGSS
jgi:uncharacterized protein